MKWLILSMQWKVVALSVCSLSLNILTLMVQFWKFLKAMPFNTSLVYSPLSVSVLWCHCMSNFIILCVLLFVTNDMTLRCHTFRVSEKCQQINSGRGPSMIYIASCWQLHDSVSTYPYNKSSVLWCHTQR